MFGRQKLVSNSSLVESLFFTSRQNESLFIFFFFAFNCIRIALEPLLNWSSINVQFHVFIKETKPYLENKHSQKKMF